MKKIAVVATNRPEQLARVRPYWVVRGGWDRLIVVEDGPEATIPGAYCWKDIDRELGEDAWIISRRDCGIKAFGFLMAYRDGADVIGTLDDDCVPIGHDWMGSHVDVLLASPAWASSVPGLRVRGLPYNNLGRMQNVMINVGLWSGVPDLDGPSGLLNPVREFKPPRGTTFAPPGRYVPMCGMNLAFRRAATPLMYFPFQGENSPYRRFDDIWAGVIAKKLCDHLGWAMAFGDPIVEHTRASDAFKNLRAEAAGIELNETFWKIVDGVVLATGSPAEAAHELGWHLRHNAEVEGYVNRVGEALQIWVRHLTT